MLRTLLLLLALTAPALAGGASSASSAMVIVVSIGAAVFAAVLFAGALAPLWHRGPE